jgi:hypothetical protein
MPANKSVWETKEIALADVVLDDENSRLGEVRGWSQGALRKVLIEDEDVLGLAKAIVASNGLYPNDLPVVMAQGDAWVVIEGNRRVCACQIIVDPGLLEEGQRGRLRPASQDLRERLSRITVIISPDRARAAPLVAALHTQQGRKPWKPAAKAFHLGRMADAGETPDFIHHALQMTVADVKGSLLDYRLLGIAQADPSLASAERRILLSINLKLNPFTRFFSLHDAGHLFPFEIDDQGALTHEGLSDQETRLVVHLVSRMFLLKEPGQDAPPFNTRTPEGDVFSYIGTYAPEVHAIVERRLSVLSPAVRAKLRAPGLALPAPAEPAGAAQVTPTEARTETPTEAPAGAQSEGATNEPRGADPGRPPGATPTGPSGEPPPAQRRGTARRHRFFQGLGADHINDDAALRNLVIEVSTIDHGRFSSAAIYLMRATVEACLVRAIKKRHLWQDLITQYPRYGLGDLLDFSKRNRGLLFNQPEQAAGLIGQWLKYKFIADKTVHTIIRGNAAQAEQASDVIRPLIEGILDGTALSASPRGGE